MTFHSVLSALTRSGAMGAGALTLAACGPDSAETEPKCLDAPASLSCTASYGLASDGLSIAPTFQQVFDNTLSTSCALPSCHRAPDPPAGLELDEINVAYRGLLGKDTQGNPRVVPGNVQCGKVIVRLQTINKPWSMPPGHHLDDETLCSIRHWIANGAPAP